MRLLFLQQFHDRGDAGRGFCGGAGVDLPAMLGHGAAFVSGVVGPDQEHGQLRLQPIVIAVLETPEDVFGAIAADPEICGLEWRPVFLPDRLTFAAPALGDGVPEEDERGLALF